MYPIDSLFLWNRNKRRAENLSTELNSLRSKLKNPNVTILVFDLVEHCVRNADIIVTATYTSTPLINRAMIKKNVHINGLFEIYFTKLIFLN